MSSHSSAPKRMAASIEASPKQVLDSMELGGLFPTGTRVYLTDIGTTSDEEFAAAARRLAGFGYVAVPHLAARRFTSRATMANRLAALRREGVDEALVIAGGLERPAGPLASSIDILRSGALEAQGFRRIAVAGHPEGSPDISDEEIAEALAWKQAWAADRGIEMRIVTQFGFDAQGFIRWAENLRRDGIEMPIHIGVSGPAKITTLIRYAAMCGVGASLDFLKKRAGSLVALATSYSPEGLVEPLEREAEANHLFLVSQIHVFPFGGLKKASEWLHARGSWTAGEDGKKSPSVAL